MKYALLTICVFLVLFIDRTGFAAGVTQSVVPTTYDQMVRELAKDTAMTSLVHVTTIGYSSKSRRRVLLVRVGDLSTSDVKVMVLCRQHGDEPAGTEGALSVIGSLARDPEAKRRLRHLCLYIVPMVNPDGAEAETRRSGDLADLNRDWGIFHEPETTAVKNAVRAIHPAFILDIHSWDMIDPFQSVCIEGPRYSAEIGPSLLLAVADLQARAAYGLQAASGQAVTATTYGDDSTETLAHRYFLHADHIASLLFETAPGPNYGESLSKRTGLVVSLLSWLIKDTALHQDAWRRLVQAEPAYTAVATSEPPSAPARPSHDFDTARRTIVSWVCFVSGCILLGWISLKRSVVGAKEHVPSPARYRRYEGTSYPLYYRTRSVDRMALQRKYAAQLTLYALSRQVRNRQV